MQFESFVGNDAAKALLAASVDSGRMPHALLIEGPKGSGKRLLAHLYAKAAVCTADQKPCGHCAACLKAETGHPDITVLEGDGTAKSLSVGVIRELREQTAVIPNEAAHKVAIIADADCMNVQAQNALLKILEEPPSYMIFVLTAQSRTQFLPTVQSRCMCVSLLGVTEDEALPILRAKLPTLSDDDLCTRLRLYSGCIGTVLDSEHDETFSKTVSCIETIAEAIVSPRELELLTATAPLEKDKVMTDAVIAGVRLVLRDAVCLASGMTTTVGVSPKAAKRLSTAMTQRRLLECLDVLETLENARQRNVNQTLLITLLCARLRAAAGR